ncbi:MAG: UDP-N-acetylmuramate dehydrogenase [Prevotellaceae bacterium]|jgi:UDP-N-acetylmuramate dehydrogenase|nr:UDP-N-acetylmuramate dehydrogenase [Prevotellaceae bacterium]
MLYNNFSLKDKNTFGFNIFAKKYFEYETEGELIGFLLENRQKTEKLLHIGAGSNLLFLGDFDGTVLHSKINAFCHCGLDPQSIENQLRTIAVQPRNDGDNDNVFVRVGAGVVFDDFCAEMVENNFGGVENLSLIPGEVGAAAVQNIGAYGAEIANIIESVETIEIKTAQKRIFSVSECNYGYRESVFKTTHKGEFIVTAVNFILSTKPKLNLEYGALKNALQNVENPTIADVRRAVISIRESKLPNPKILGNAGSFFKNPYCCKTHFLSLQKDFPSISYYAVNDEIVKLSAAWLIEQCGLKGAKIGGAQVYENQPLVLVNIGNATPQDIAQLSAEIQRRVKEKFSIELETEVNFI